MGDVHKQVVHEQLYAALVLASQYIGKAQAVLRTQRVVADECETAVVGEILEAFDIE